MFVRPGGWVVTRRDEISTSFFKSVLVLPRFQRGEEFKISTRGRGRKHTQSAFFVPLPRVKIPLINHCFIISNEKTHSNSSLFGETQFEHSNAVRTRRGCNPRWGGDFPPGGDVWGSGIDFTRKAPPPVPKIAPWSRKF